MPSTVSTPALFKDPVLCSLLEAAGVWLWETDLRTDVTEYQPGFWEQYGYEAPQLAETFDFLHVVHTSDLREITRLWRTHLDGETQSYASRWRLRANDCSWRWIQARGRVTERDAAGRPLRIAGAYTDVTDVMNMSEGLHNAAAELDAVFRSSRDGIALVAPDLSLLRANDAIFRILRETIGSELLPGQNILSLPRITSEQVVITDILQVLSGRTAPDRLVQVPGGSHWLEFSYSPSFRPDGAVLGVAVTLRDVSERVRLEQARTQAMRIESLGLMAGGIAHDFNNLLAAIVGNLDLAELSALDPDARDALGEARAAAKRAHELVEQLLAYAGKQQPVRRPVNLSTVAAEIVRYARKIPGHQANLELELGDNLPLVEADINQLRQLVLNLVVNGIEAAAGQPTTVRVRSFRTESPDSFGITMLLEAEPAACYVGLEVADDGEGMDATTLARIFDPFFSTKPSGHGLGLGSVLGTVRNHGGTLGVQSEPGKGATFIIAFPAA